MAGRLDSPFQLNHALGELELMTPEKLFSEITLLEAYNLYITPTPAPLLVEFGTLGETWRLSEDAQIPSGEPLLSSFNLDLPAP